MVLDNLKQGLRATLKKLVGASSIDENIIKELARDVQRSLLQADVNVRLVLELTNRLQERALKEQPPPGLSRKDHIVKILYEELSRLLGGDEVGLPLRKDKS
ncbi:MAG: signal recognition particle receptor subunit alpha, partial [Candidatus Nitrosocaldus sp.]